jgi:GTPase SAR1 family protein
MATSSRTITLALVGDGTVGKSSITQAFVKDGFSPVYRQVGLDLPRQPHVLLAPLYRPSAREELQACV